MKSIDVLKKLVAFNSEPSRSNLDLLDWVESYLADYGITATRVYDAGGTKANIYARVGPSCAGGIILSGHTDVVPVDGQTWDTPPFELTIRDGRAYGRGTCDMKGFVSTALAALPQMVAENLTRPIYFALSYDEELGCVGAPSMIAELVKKLPPVDAVVVGEPTNMKVIENHKGMMAGHVSIVGRDAHSSMPQLGVDSNLAAHAWMTDIIAVTEKLRAGRQVDSPFDPPYSTINIGTLQGGAATNIVAGTCKIGWSARVMDHDDPAAMIAELQRATDKIDAQLKAQDATCGAVLTIDTQVPALTSEPNPVAADLARSITGDNGRNQVVSFATEGGQFQDGGYSVVVCGPGSIEQAHKPNEFIELSQLEAGDAFIQKIIERQRM
ncbi:acetylornithine deacetylase [Pacificibacter marinus]|uniref:acetylornithine deacetylase n=1 Tax=Pacificibacter marinus TaxID=658057 RepID=UPI001C07A2B0|nr:acetylornithine deacetylase [Pacificibacter marinus]MBU2866417.1 acetylornithine deacetylase [Pacificibacter marinus]